MLIPFILSNNYDMDDHHFRMYSLDKNHINEWLNLLADEYIKLRTRRKHALEGLSTEEITIMDTTLLEKYRMFAIRSAGLSIPTYSQGNFNVLRSDFGELICYLLLEQYYSTKLGYKSISERDTIHLPARGIDAIGIEGIFPFKLVISEVKVSDEDASPPQVVDGGKDGLRKQHLEHIKNRKTKTKEKIIDLSRRTDDQEFSNHLTFIAFLLDEEDWIHLQMIVCSVLIRPEMKHTKKDFGSFWSKTHEYQPAYVRFLVACVPNDIDIILEMWDKIIAGKLELLT